jgi:hypothetical protein
MDPRRFDTLVQTLSAAASRRRALAVILAGLAAPRLAGLAAAAKGNGRGQARGTDRGAGRDRKQQPRQATQDRAAKKDERPCRHPGQPCDDKHPCCDPGSTICGAGGRGAVTRCTSCDPGEIACGNQCIPACTAHDQCHEAGECDPDNHVCTNPAKADGASCNADGDACTVGDTCQSGTCVAGPAKTCPVCQACRGGDCESVADDPNCARICCGGECCLGVRACDASGACVTCAQTCPASCDVCFNLTDGTTKCGTGSATPGSTSGTACRPCSSNAECPADFPFCVFSQTVRETNESRITATEVPGQPPFGFCPDVPASIGGACFRVQDC